jgi:hypothetical protein
MKTTSVIGASIALSLLGLTGCGSTSSSSSAPERKVVIEGAPIQAAGQGVTPTPGAAAAPASSPSLPPGTSSTTRNTTPLPSASAPAAAPVAAAPVATAPIARVPAAAPAESGYRVPEGVYRCEEGKRVVIKRGTADGKSLVANYGNKDYSLNFQPVTSGAVRYESSASGFAWIMTADKAMLFDTKGGRRLANGCKL